MPKHWSWGPDQLWGLHPCSHPKMAGAGPEQPGLTLGSALLCAGDLNKRAEEQTLLPRPVVKAALHLHCRDLTAVLGPGTAPSSEPFGPQGVVVCCKGFVAKHEVKQGRETHWHLSTDADVPGAVCQVPGLQLPFLQLPLGKEVEKPAFWVAACEPEKRRDAGVCSIEASFELFLEKRKRVI